MAYGVPASVLGLIVSGDLGNLTIYTDRHGRKAEYPISPPKEPASPLQLRQRDRFRQAQAAWASLTPGEKFNLEETCRLLSLCLTGQNLFVSAALTGRRASYDLLPRQTGLPLPPLPEIV